MRSVIVSVLGVSSVFLVVMMHSSINTISMVEEEVTEALSCAMEQTLTEVVDQENHGIKNRNEMIAAFLQAMLQKISADVDLTVKIHEMNYDGGVMDVEVIGKYPLTGTREKTITLRRKIALS